MAQTVKFPAVTLWLTDKTFQDDILKLELFSDFYKPIHEKKLITNKIIIRNQI